MGAAEHKTKYSFGHPHDDRRTEPASESPLRERTLVLLAVTTGLRRSEGFALKWKDVDFQTKTDLRHTINRPERCWHGQDKMAAERAAWSQTCHR